MEYLMKDMNDINVQVEEYSRRGKYHELVVILEHEIKKTENVAKKYDYELKLAEIYYSMRKFSKAKTMAEKLIPLVQEESKLNLIGDVENLLGKIYRIHQRYDEATLHYHNAQRSFTQANNKAGLAKIYHNIGNVHVFLGEFKEALKNHNKALELAQQEGKDEAIASSFLNIGSTHYQNGEVDKAIESFKKAKEIYESIQDEPALAAVHLNLAETNLLRRDYSAAIDNSSISCKLYEKQNNEIGLKLALTLKGRAEKSSGLFANAIETFSNVVTLFTNDVQEDVYIELGESFLFANKQIEAKETFEKILELPGRTPQGTGFALDYLAKIAIELENLGEARRIYSQLLNLLYSREPQDNDSIVSTQANLGFVLLRKGEFTKAWEVLKSCYTYFTKKKNMEDLTALTNNFRDYLIFKEDYAHAITIIENFIIPAVIKISKEKNRIRIYNYEVAFLYYLMGKKDEALKYWNMKLKKKRTFQKISPTFLNSLILDEKKREELKHQHVLFLKNIQDKEKSNE
jgi:tetratricopeptide (TPR) repeat protein